MCLWRFVILCVYASIVTAAKELKIGVITDVHIGENCHGDLSYEVCKPVRALTDAVNQLNTLDLDGVFISGDLTSSALYDEYTTFRSICDTLNVPWWPAIGNHDIWPYSKHDDTFNQTNTPIGDQYFGDVYGDILSGEKWSGAVTSSWPTSTCLNADFNYPSWFHNFVVTFPSFSKNFQFLVLDWNARETALPEPGVGPQAELHNFTCGTFDWLNTTLKEGLEKHIEQFFIVQHHPFHNRDSLDPFGFNVKYNFTFDKHQDFALQELLSTYYDPSAYIGSIAGHLHRWYNGTAFNKYTASSASFLRLPAYETPACKGWWIDEDFTSALQVITFVSDGGVRIASVDGYWKMPDGRWDMKPGVTNDIWGHR